VKAAIADVRKDSVDTNWVLLNYADESTLQLAAKGSGGIEELAARLDAKECYYALFRTSVLQDKTTKVIFCSLKLLSMEVSTVARAKLVTHKGFVDKLFSPVHTEFTLDDPAAFTPEVVEKQVASITLTASHLVGHHEPTGSAPMLHRPKVEEKKRPEALVNTGGSGLRFEDETAFRTAITTVKNDTGGNTWLLARYAAKDTLGLVATGTGGVEAWIEQLEADNVNFVYMRVTDRVDKTDAIKFVFVKYQPESVGAIKKGQINAKKGEIEATFQPFHVSLQAAAKTELTTEAIMDLVRGASGTKSHVM